jgi:anti-anti-sigma regulatory factor
MVDRVVTGTIEPGDHACLTFSDPEERLDLVAAFVRTGLRAGSKVVCWTDAQSPDRLAAELAVRSVRAGAALRRGQLEIAPISTSLLGSATVDASRMVDTLTGELEAAGRSGYPSLRITADMGWATQPLAAAQELVAFESAVAGLFTDGRLCLICQYDRDRFDAVTLAFAAKAHPKTLTAQVYCEHPLLRICRQYSPPGLRIGGELDYRHRDILEQALAESLRLDRHLHVNLAGLSYTDGACAGSIVAAAARLPASRWMSVICRPVVATVLDLVGAGTTAKLRVQVFDERR